MGNRRFLFLALLSLCTAGAELARAGRGQKVLPVKEHEFAQLPGQGVNPNCKEWKGEACTVCGIDSTIDISLKNKTKTPIFLCRDMKPGPARVAMTTHAEPSISGLWEVEFGLGYRTSARHECPHQFIASNNPPLKTAYEVGPITIEGDIPSDGMIQAVACVGLSSVRVGGEGKETGASLRISTLRVVSE